MKKLYILMLLSSHVISTQAQDGKDILIESFKKCQSIKSGHFMVTGELKKGFTSNKYSYKINFRKTPSDTLATCLYNAQMVANKNKYSNIIYNGKSYITYNIPVKTYYSNTSSVVSTPNWLLPVEMNGYNNSNISNRVFNTEDWFYRGLDIPAGLFGQYSYGNNWQTPSPTWSNFNQGEIIPTSKYSYVVKQKCFNDVFMLYEPIMAKKSTLLPNYAELSDSNTVIEFVNIETLNGYKCWHVKAIKAVNNDTLTTDEKGVYTTNYWINMQDFIPVQFSITKESLASNRVLFFRQYAITDYNFDVPKEDWYFSTARVPSEITLKKYVAVKIKKP